MRTYADFNIDLPSSPTRAEVYTNCPQCSHTRRKKRAKCLSVNIDKGCWICHHCDWRGSLKTGVDGKSDPFKWRVKTYTKPEYGDSQQLLPSNVIAWFTGRGITPEVLSRNKIGYGQIYMPQEEDWVNAIQFPYFRDKEVVNIKYRDGKKNFRQVSGAEKIVYGLNDINPDYTIITEGEIDKLSFEMVGMKYCISVPDGAPPVNTSDYSNKFSYLETCQKELEPVKSFFLAVDSDEPGKKLEEELARRIGYGKCYKVQWPADCKDANDVLVKHGKETLQICFYDAIPYPIAGIYEVDALSEDLEELYERGFPKGVSTGFLALDPYYTVRAGEWTVVTGIPGHGKTMFVDSVLVNLSKAHDWSFGVCSPENQPIQRHMARIMEKYTKESFSGAYKMNKETMLKAKDWVSNHFRFILPPEDKLTIDGVLELARICVYRYGINGLVIDPWNEFDHTRPAGQTETEYISYTLTRVRRFARENNIHVWLIAHPAKLQKNKTDDSYPIPTPYDISGSAHWRNKADNCLTIWRSFKENDPAVDIHIQKIRFREIGKTGMCQVKYDWKTGCYDDFPVAKLNVISHIAESEVL